MSERRTTQYDNRPPIDNHNYLRSNRNNRKKKILGEFNYPNHNFHIVAITGYSMYKQPIFNLAFANQPISYGQIKDFQNTVTQIGTLNINLSQLANLEDVPIVSYFFNTFFILTIVSLVITILTIIFNRTLLKILNFIVISILLIMSVLDMQYK